MGYETIALYAAVVLLAVQVLWPALTPVVQRLFSFMRGIAMGSASADPPAVTVRLSDLAAIRRQLDRIESMLREWAE